MVRTRFAPSPTGRLHLGNVRTAVFAWAYARRHGGQFILRIEDTDLARSTDEYKQAIVDDLKWLGVDWDEGPITQMSRMPRYREVITQMVAQGLAYPCYMSVEELDVLRAKQEAANEKPRYNGHWRPENIAKLGLVPPAGVKPVIRFKNPTDGVVAWDDAVKGRIEISNAELDDLIIARPDGTPTYNFCVVIDDWDMKITHVLRGDDHVNNTPRQINIFNALNAPLPVFGHTPTVLGASGEKLSKRDGATSLGEYHEMGYLPQTMINFLARLGWSHGDDEVFSPQQLCEWFNLEHINPAPGRFNAEKLAWLNQEHMKLAPKEELATHLQPFMRSKGIDTAGKAPLAEAAHLFRERATDFMDMAEQVRFFYEPIVLDSALVAQHLTDANRPALQALATQFASVEWTAASISAAVKAIVAQHSVKMPQIMMPLRVAITGRANSPAVDGIAALIGRETATHRLAAMLEH
jgi:glutamyl-tRNA synthetase